MPPKRKFGDVNAAVVPSAPAAGRVNHGVLKSTVERWIREQLQPGEVFMPRDVAALAGGWAPAVQAGVDFKSGHTGKILRDRSATAEAAEDAAAAAAEEGRPYERPLLRRLSAGSTHAAYTLWETTDAQIEAWRKRPKPKTWGQVTKGLKDFLRNGGLPAGQIVHSRGVGDLAKAAGGAALQGLVFETVTVTAALDKLVTQEAPAAPPGPGALPALRRILDHQGTVAYMRWETSEEDISRWRLEQELMELNGSLTLWLRECGLEPGEFVTWCDAAQLAQQHALQRLQQAGSNLIPPMPNHHAVWRVLGGAADNAASAAATGLPPLRTVPLPEGANLSCDGGSAYTHVDTTQEDIDAWVKDVTARVGSFAVHTWLCTPQAHSMLAAGPVTCGEVRRLAVQHAAEQRRANGQAALPKLTYQSVRIALVQRHVVEAAPAGAALVAGMAPPLRWVNSEARSGSFGGLAAVTLWTTPQDVISRWDLEVSSQNPAWVLQEGLRSSAPLIQSGKVVTTTDLARSAQNSMQARLQAIGSSVQAAMPDHNLADVTARFVHDERPQQEAPAALRCLGVVGIELRYTLWSTDDATVDAFYNAVDQAARADSREKPTGAQVMLRSLFGTAAVDRYYFTADALLLSHDHSDHTQELATHKALKAAGTDEFDATATLYLTDSMRCSMPAWSAVDCPASAKGSAGHVAPECLPLGHLPVMKVVRIGKDSSSGTVVVAWPNSHTPGSVGFVFGDEGTREVFTTTADACLDDAQQRLEASGVQLGLRQAACSSGRQSWLGSRPAGQPARGEPQIAAAVAAAAAAEQPEQPEQKQGGMGRTLGLALLFGVWYMFNIQFNIYNKVVLKAFPYPLTVTAMHFLVGSLLACLMWLFRLHKKPEANIFDEVKTIAPLAAIHTLGNSLTMISLGAVAVSFTHTIKALEPMFSVMFSMLFLGDKPSLPVVLSLLPIIGGVVLASTSELSFTWKGFLSALGSNITFQSRNVLSKKFMNAKSSLDNINLFSIITMMAFCLLAPIALITEGIQFTPQAMAAAGIADPFAVMQKALLAGICFHGYQQVSYLILQRVSPVTHSIGNSVKRVVVIASSIIVFRNPVTTQNLVGTAIALAGVFAYSQVKRGAGKKAKAA